MTKWLLFSLDLEAEFAIVIHGLNWKAESPNKQFYFAQTTQTIGYMTNTV